jgi:transcriptional regulator with XRE-family HTH domain
MLNKEVGKRLKRLREVKLFTQIEAARNIGISTRSLQYHENGELPNQNNLQKYIDFYGCDRDWLLTGKGEPFNKERRILGAADPDGLYGKIERIETGDSQVDMTFFGNNTKSEPGLIKPPAGITEDELALIRTLRLCGEEYKHRVYVAATVRAQRIMEGKKLETDEKLTAQHDLEILSTKAIS